MAMDAVEKIKSAEKAGIQAQEAALEQARNIQQKAKEDGTKWMEARKKEAEQQAAQIIEDARKKADFIEQEGVSRNRDEIAVLQSIIEKKMDAAVQEAVKLIFE